VKKILFLLIIFCTHTVFSEIEPYLNTLTRSLNELHAQLQKKPHEKKEISIVQTLLNQPMIETRPNQHLYQIRVLKQPRAADCGYNALKNALFFLQGIENPGNIEQKLADLRSKNAYETIAVQWVADIREKRNLPRTAELKKCDWLRGDEIDFLYKNTPNKPTYGISVIDNIEWLQPPYLGFDKERLKPALKLIDRKTNAMAFLLSFSQEGGGGTHWIAIGIYRDNDKNYYFIFNSTNSKTITNRTQYIETIKTFMEKTNRVQLAIDLSEIGQQLLEDLDYKMKVIKGEKYPGRKIPKYEAFTTLLVELPGERDPIIPKIIQIAKAKTVFDTPEFLKIRQKLIEDLEAIEKNVPNLAKEEIQQIEKYRNILVESK